MKESIIVKKSYDFALKTIVIYKELKRQHEFVLAKQFLKSGTSVGANISESQGASSKKDFLYKIQIAYKEARESIYWINLMKDSNIGDPLKLAKLEVNGNELLKILTSIIKTTKQSLP